MRMRALLVGIFVVAVSSVHASDVLILGDSMMQTLAPEMVRRLGWSGIEAKTAATNASGLVRVDRFNWHEEAESVLQQHKARTVVVMLGLHDNHSMRTSAGEIPFDASGWDIEYGRRVGQFMDLLLVSGAEKIVWLGLPCMRDADRDRDGQRVMRIVSQQAEARSAVTYFSTRTIFCTGESAFDGFITLPNDTRVEVIADDGIHLNQFGAEHVAQIVIEKFFAQ